MNYKLNAHVGDNLYSLFEQYKTDNDTSYEEIAAELGLVTPRVLYRWFNGECLPSISRMSIIVDKLHVSYDDILR